MKRTTFMLNCAALIAGSFSCAIATGQTPWIERAHLAFATAKSTSLGALGRQQIFVKHDSGSMNIIDLGLSQRIPISALSIDGDDTYFSTAVMWRMNDALVTPRDIVKLAADGSREVFLHGENIGLDEKARISGLSVDNGEILIALDMHAEIAGVKVKHSDILEVDSGVVSVLHSLSEHGLPDAMRVAAVDRTETGTIYLTFSSGGVVDGISAMPGDVIEFIPNSDSWSTAIRRDQLGLECNPCDVNALALETSMDTIFKDYFRN